MSNLFIKFLPEEGEIKEGDYYFNGKNELRKYGDWGITKPSRADKIVWGWKKVLPHLCTRDIQVGDKYWTTHDDYPVESDVTLTPTELRFITDRGAGYKFFKVLGLVSPDATWVTDGMEVKEEDVNIFAYDVDDPDWTTEYSEYLKIKDDELYNDLNLKVMVKLRCPSSNKHFH